MGTLLIFKNYVYVQCITFKFESIIEQSRSLVTSFINSKLFN